MLIITNIFPGYNIRKLIMIFDSDESIMILKDVFVQYHNALKKIL
jgi:hypothetical protein